MKYFIIPALLLFVTLGLGQSTYTIKPVISTTGLSSTTAVGNDTVTSSAAFGSVAVGQRVVGPGVPFGSTVTKVISTSAILISQAATAAATVTLRFGYFTSIAYAAGDALGFPFAVPTMKNLKQVVVIDDAKQITSVDMVFFSSTFTETADTAAFAISDADAEGLVGYLTVGGTGANKALSNNTVMVLPFTTIGPSFSQSGKMYCQLIAVDTPTFTAVDNLTVKFIYE